MSCVSCVLFRQATIQSGKERRMEGGREPRQLPVNAPANLLEPVAAGFSFFKSEASLGECQRHTHTHVRMHTHTQTHIHWEWGYHVVNTSALTVSTQSIESNNLSVRVKGQNVHGSMRAGTTCRCSSRSSTKEQRGQLLVGKARWVHVWFYFSFFFRYTWLTLLHPSEKVTAVLVGWLPDNECKRQPVTSTSASQHCHYSKTNTASHVS